MNQYTHYQGLVIRGVFSDIRGLCVLQTEDFRRIFFIPEDSHQNNENFFEINNFTSISDKEKKYLYELYGYKTKGRWIDGLNIARTQEDQSLFSFITSSEFALHQIIIQLHKEIL